MAGRFVDASPLPGGAYSGSMSVADIYSSHVGIGGIRTQDRALPAFAEATLAAAANRVDFGKPLEDQLMGQPAGWLALGVIAILALAWVLK